MSELVLSLEIKEGEVRVDSRIICDGLGLENHTNYRRFVLEKYEASIALLGVCLKTTLADGTIVWYLNEAQANFAGTLSRNTKEAVEFKLRLVQAFSAMRAQIQSDLEKKIQPTIATPSQKEIRASYSLWKMAHGKAYADRWLLQMHKRHYPALVGDAPHSSEMASLPTAKALLTPTQIAEELKVLYRTGSGNGSKINSLLKELGYQESIGGRWSATQKAIDTNLCDRKPVDTNSRTQKDQLLWSSDIVPVLSEHLVKN